MHLSADRLRNRVVGATAEAGLGRILVTGAAGFIGRGLCSELARRGHVVLGATRGPGHRITGVELRPVGDIGPQTVWSDHLAGVDIIIHLATRAHRPSNAAAGEVEVKATAALAHAAAAARVRRFVLISSLRAMGETTQPAAPFRAGDPMRPGDLYGRTKLAIEEALMAVARQTGLDMVIIRPPLVYGPCPKGNLRALMRGVASGLPLPFAGVDNRRSLIGLDNLVDLAAIACVHPAARGQVLLARDMADLSTPGLIRALAAGLGSPARLFSIPSAYITAVTRLPVFGAVFSRLTTSLQADDAETRRMLGWSPSVATENGVAAMARAYRRQ